MSDRRINLAQRVAYIVRHFAIEELSKLEMSQDDYERLAQKIGSDVADEVVRDFDIGVIFDENEIKNEKGQLNASPVIDCLRQMAENARKESDRAKLNHLVQHLTHTMKDLRLFSDPLAGGNSAAEQQAT